MISEERLRLPSIPLTTRVLRSGTGPPVLLLHGSPDSASEWRPVMEALGPGVACVAPDLPGLGACEEPPPSFDYSRAACEGFLDELLRTLGIDRPVVLVVHDIGGVMGIPWAARNRGRVQGVVITNTVIFERFRWFGVGKLWGRNDSLGRAMAAAMMWQIGWLRGRIFGRAFGRISPELRASDLQRMVLEFACDPKSKRSTLRLFRRMIRPAYFDGVDAMVRTLVEHVPVRVVWGQGDPYIPARYANAFPGVDAETLPAAGHWVPLSAPERVAAAVHSVIGSSGTTAIAGAS
ncbi:MAG TPA: alpha/beta fold hydrolase [Myxococcaceae bacterium]|nr:alpha/beta fold hydrolase [Myxococcaceae bacterium]